MCISMTAELIQYIEPNVMFYLCMLHADAEGLEITTEGERRNVLLSLSGFVNIFCVYFGWILV